MRNDPDFSVEFVSGDRPIRPTTLADWEAFVTRCESVHLEQMWEWGQVRRIDGWQPHLLVIRHEELIVAGALLLTRKLNRFARIGYVSRGPLVKAPESGRASAATRCVARQLKKTARELRLGYLIADLPYAAGLLPDELKSVGFTRHLSQLPPSGLSNGTAIVDLTLQEEQLERGLRRTLRQNIRQAEKGGVVIREGGENDIPLLWKLMLALCARRGVPPNVSDSEVMRRLWRAFLPSNRVRLDIAEVNGKPAAALMTVFIGNWAIPWRVGWSGDASKLHPEKFLYWSVIRAARERGCAVFDFNWIDLREVEALRSGAPPSPSPNSGITFFKLGFGGKAMPLPGAMDYFPNPIVRAGMRWAGNHALVTRLVRHALQRQRSRRTAAHARVE